MTATATLRRLDRLDRCLWRADDDQLARLRDPVTFARLAGIEPDPWQVEALCSPASRILLNCSRQSGKSVTSALIGLRQALFEPRSLVLFLAPSQRQAGEIFRTCLGLYRALDRPVRAVGETALSLTLGNGSRLVSLPGKEATVRCYSGVNALIIDEASRVPDELVYAVRPMLATSGGRLLALSTPFGTRGWFYEAWRGEEPWERYEVPATLCPRIPAEFLEEERRVLGQFWFEAEYCCAFLDAQTQAFSRADIDRAFEEEVTAWDL